MNEKPTYFVEKTYYNLDKSESVVIKIPHDTDFSRPPREVKRLGIWCSGGADSTALLYLLAKTIKDNDLDVYIQPMTVRRQRPWNPIKAAPVIEKVCEILDFDRMLPHEVYYPPLEDPNQTEWQEFMDRDRENYKNGVWHVLYDGLTSNPPESEMPYENLEEHRRGENIEKQLEAPARDHMRPLYQINKRFIADIYRQFDLTENLFPITWSCEGEADQTNDYTIPCDQCWWCWEREWAFDND